MKGLILKDLYMTKAYCKSYLLIIAVFFAVSLFAGKNMFFVFYPCLICGMLPVNLLAYDERSRFLQYSLTLPYTKSQIVSEKYLMGLFSEIAVIILTGIAQGIKMAVNGAFNIGEFCVLLLLTFVVSAFSYSVSLPFIFKYGTEKGRLAYYIMIGFVCALSVLFSSYFGKGFKFDIPSWVITAVLLLIGLSIYVLSWCLSVLFFKKREF